MKKKWWILNHHSEGNCFYMVNATVEEIDTLRCLIDNNARLNKNCLYYDCYWGCVEVVSPGFATKEECQEYFNTAKEFTFFRQGGQVMNNKYEARIFPNGRVVCYERKDLDDAINAGKELLIVCNCHTGGFTEAIGATEEPERIRYSDYIHEQVFTEKEMAKFHKIIFTEGEKIFDNNFDYATQYDSIYHRFYDGDREMQVDEKTTARCLYKEQVKAMIEIGLLTEKALDYCIQAPVPVKSSVDCCSG